MVLKRWEFSDLYYTLHCIKISASKSKAGAGRRRTASSRRTWPPWTRATRSCAKRASHPVRASRPRTRLRTVQMQSDAADNHNNSYCSVHSAIDQRFDRFGSTQMALRDDLSRKGRRLLAANVQYMYSTSSFNSRNRFVAQRDMKRRQRQRDRGTARQEESSCAHPAAEQIRIESCRIESGTLEPIRSHVDVLRERESCKVHIHKQLIDRRADRRESELCTE